MTVSKELVDAFLSSSDYADLTKESYLYALNRIVNWMEERGGTLEKLSVVTYNQFLNSHNWSNNGKRTYGAALRAFFRWAGQPDHPIFTQKLPVDDAAPGRALDTADLCTLLASFDTHQAVGRRNTAMLALMVETGLRASEVCRLELARLDLRHQKFTVQVKGKKRGERKWREAIFSADVSQFLQVWLADRPKIAKKDVKTLFVSIGGTRPGTPMSRSGLKAIFRTFGNRTDIGKLSPHDMRRTMAVLLIERGAPTRLVQVLGGWDDIRMVERYTQTLRPGQIERYSPLKAMGVTIAGDPKEKGPVV